MEVVTVNFWCLVEMFHQCIASSFADKLCIGNWESIWLCFQQLVIELDIMVDRLQIGLAYMYWIHQVSLCLAYQI